MESSPASSTSESSPAITVGLLDRSRLLICMFFLTFALVNPMTGITQQFHSKKDYTSTVEGRSILYSEYPETSWGGMIVSWLGTLAFNLFLALLGFAWLLMYGEPRMGVQNVKDGSHFWHHVTRAESAFEEVCIGIHFKPILLSL